jgi:hypothetical protein
LLEDNVLRRYLNLRGWENVRLHKGKLEGKLTQIVEYKRLNIWIDISESRLSG